MSGGSSPRLAWRNLWRNPRRTWLTAGGVAFAVFLVVSAMSLQLGSYTTMEETATSLLTGQIQIHNADYVENERIEHSLPAASALRAQVAAVAGVEAVAPRVEAFALASAGDRSFGARVLGIEPASHGRVVRFHEQILRGRHLEGSGEAVLGDALARNLGVGLGEEVVVLGSARQGGVAALVLDVVGLFRTGMAELDRGLMLAPLADTQEAFALPDQVHTLVIRAASLNAVPGTVARLRSRLPDRWPAGEDGEAVQIRGWSEVLPELRQAIALDWVSAALLYWIVMILVAFSVANTFIMAVFERTREFGMLLAIGMRPVRIVTMLQWEALLMWALGSAVGLALASALTGWLAHVGVYLGEGMEQMATEMYLPTRVYPEFSATALATAPLVMLVATQIAAVLPSLRVNRMRPVDALRVAA
ncbi:MAG: ABC transporter permease [Pseudomonadota bacterium]